ncbi:MAG: adenylyl-sulfate kinase [Rikenellaceae bacterium]
MSKNIHPIFDRTLQRSDRETLLSQKAKVVWFTGLSGSGKSTLAIEIEKELYNRGYLCCILDGDNIRAGINNNLGFSEEDRVENIRRIAEVSKLLLNTGVITLAAFVSPTNNIRHLATEIIGKEDFLEIYVNTPLEVCEQRDVKGLYKKARRGEIKDFTGIGSPFETPDNPSFTIDTSKHTLKDNVDMLLSYILEKFEK